MRSSVRRSMTRWNQGAAPVEVTDEIAVEEPLEIRVGGKPASVTMRTPGHDMELAAGFLLTEALLDPATRPILRHEQPNIVNAAVANLRDGALERLNRISFVASSCGMCGKASIQSVHQHFDPVHREFRVSRQVLASLDDSMRAEQSGFSRNGGVHAAAVFDSTGRLMVAREDIGRHNAVDKVIGHGLLRGLLPWETNVLLVSGRASFEIVQKALAARIPIVAAVSAPSSLAVSFAEESGQTLVGFLRPGRLNVYTHPERITG